MHFSRAGLIVYLRMYGKVFRRAREARNLTITELSRITGVSRRYLTAMELDEANVSIKYLLLVANALGVDELTFDAFCIRVTGTDVTGVVLSEVVEALDRLTAVRELLLSKPREIPERVSRSGANEALLGDLVRTAMQEPGGLADAPIAGRLVTADALPRALGERTLWSPEWFLPVEQFVPVAYAYPELENDRFLLARVLDNSMEPGLRAGDVVRIDTAIRAPKAGDLVAVHGMVSGSVLGVVQDERLPMLVRSNAPPVLIWQERHTIQGVVCRAA